MEQEMPIFGEFGRWRDTIFRSDLLTAYDFAQKLVFFDASLLRYYVAFVMAKAGYALLEPSFSISEDGSITNEKRFLYEGEPATYYSSGKAKKP